MSPAKTKPKNSVIMDAGTSLEHAMLAIAEGAASIAVTQNDGVIGKVSRKDITAAISLDR